MKIQRFSKISLAIFLSFNIFLGNTSIVVKADSLFLDNAYATIENNKITIGNDYISREFSINENKISTSLIENKRANTTLVPSRGSEDFVINTISNEKEEELSKNEAILPSNELDRTNWKGTLTSKSGRAFSESEVKKLFDNNPNTYVDNYLISGYPISLIIDLGEVKEVSSFSYLKRPGYSDRAYGINGTMGKYKLYVSEDKVNWSEAGSGEFTRADHNLHQVGSLYNVGDFVYGNFYKTYNTRYVKIDQLSDALGSTSEFTGSEIKLFSDKYILTEEKEEEKEEKNTKIKSSDLTIDNKSTKVEDIENGKKLVISYNSYTLEDIVYDIDLITVIENDDHYMRSFLEIKTDNNEAKIDYIDIDNFVLSSSIMDTVWAHPDLTEVSSMWMGKNELMLGQPIYVNGIFLGSEFPATDTDVVDGKTQIRYYSGKSFGRLAEDNQLTRDGKFVSWQNVIGSAKGVDTDVVQTDFYEYISEISTPTDFRKQYNSWYDNMMSITDESIEKSFYGAEKGLTKNGVEPVDSYVVDDGWNNYRDSEFNANIGSDASGNSLNRTGFWEFNDKFPNELYTSTELTQNLQSKFGVWIGPQGGYNYFGGFAKYLEKMSTGYIQSDYWTNVCVGSDKYVKNLTELFVDYQTRFDVDYWKIDGFAVRPCTNASHDHMTGGHNNMYYTTDLWEKWIDAWEEMRANRAEEGKGLFINATCYVNLSPWILQWVNTVWVQDSGDTGEAGTGARHQQKITYRDNVYYNLLKKNQLQFPLKNIYNHDPIYGVSDGSSATTEDFRDFLFSNAVRGTAFWELYYSPSIMDDSKWQVNADALDFAEKYSYILENAKLFGNVPTQGVYGYSSWNGNEGIISFRNPTASEQTYSLQLTDIIGVPRLVSNLKANQVLPYVAGQEGSYSYGDTITVNLKPYETRIIQYGNTDSVASDILSAKVTGENEITVKYNERVANVQEAYTVKDNSVVETKLLDDYRTIVITTEKALSGTLELNINGEMDSVGNQTTASLNINAYENSEIALVESDKDLLNAEGISKTYNGNLGMFFMNINKAYKVNTNNSFEGTTDFGINMTVKTTSTGVNLFKQGDDIVLSIDDDGYLNFKVKDLSLNSKSKVTTVVEKAYGIFGTSDYVPTSTLTEIVGKINDGEMHQVVAVREVNGMIKIYIDGELSNSVYDSSKINQPISKGEIIIGDDNFNGVLGRTEFRNSSIYYDEVERNYSSYGEESIIEYDRSEWTASACSEMPGTSGDAAAQAAIDGNLNSWWHTNYVGGDTHKDNHWIAVDFGKSIYLDTVKLIQRGAGSNGTIKEYKLEAKINDVWQIVKEGTFTDGVNSVIELDESIYASGIKITSLSTFNGQNFAAIKEIYVSQKDRLATSEEIEETINSIKEIEESDYTIATVNRYKDILSKVKHLEAIYTKALGDLKQAMEDAYNSLLDAKDLNKLIKLANSLDKDIYTEDSWSTLSKELLNAKAVVESIKSTKADVDLAKENLEKAINDLNKINEETEVTITLERDILDIKANTTDKLVAILNPAESTEEVTWISLDSSIATVDENGNVTGIEVGTTTIKASISNGSKAEATINVTINKEALDLEILEAENIINNDGESKYSVSSWKVFKDAYDLAIEAKEALTQKDVNEATENLRIERETLAFKVNKEELATKLEESKNLVSDTNKYSKLSFKNLKEAIEKADLILNNDDATKDEVSDSNKELVDAINNLFDITEINELLESTNSLLESDYTKSSYNNLLSLKDELEKLLERDDVSKETLEAAKADLEAKINELVRVSDKLKLEEEVKTYEKLVESYYTAESFKNFKLELDKAKEVLLNDEATQEEVDNAITLLKQSVDALVKVITEEKPIEEKPIEEKPVEEKPSVEEPSKPVNEVDKSKLEELIKKAEGLSKKNYTEESWKTLSEALDNSNKLFNNKEATQEEVNLSINNLETAINVLKEQRPSVVNNPNKNSIDNKNNNGSLPSTGGLDTSSITLVGAVTSLIGVALWRKKNVNK